MPESRKDTPREEIPYLKVEILEITDPKPDIEKLYAIMSKNFRKYNEGGTKMIDTKPFPSLLLTYRSKQIFEEAFARELNLFQFVVQLITESKITVKSEIKLKPEQIPTQCYAIIRKSTNDKVPMRNESRVTEFICQHLLLDIWIEEITDGFLYFYRSKRDFEFWHVDKTDFSELEVWLQEVKIQISPEDYEKAKKIADASMERYKKIVEKASK